MKRILLSTLVAVSLVGCGAIERPENPTAVPTSASATTGVDISDVSPVIPALPAGLEAKQTTSGLRYVDIVVGTGPEVIAGSTAEVYYTGYLKSDGSQFDSNVGEQLFPVQNVGSAMVIDGWNEGLVGMKQGGKRRLIIPSALGYGAQGQGAIPGNADLVFDVEVVVAR
ncbi:FKBP-type peptidyl-prolyl cis-trans isomerase [Herpetosiphon geysericola]|uniref:FKBP-type peptidyl-prolyl cis-trans isomerase n=1 Tax=Herpetosiphon geysericola TaxID=70996 RepID=UPI000A981761|nr:FKBP-type peptidyl-prolyl cis-trans isomerase [Herpetosiphon geysericola]